RAGRVGQRERKALVAPGVLERVEPDEADALDRATARRLEHRRSGGEVVELAGDRVDLVEVGIEYRAEVGPVGSAGDPVQASPQPADPPCLDEGQHEQDERGDPEAGDGRPDVRCDEGVEIDRGVLRAGVTWRSRAPSGPSLAGGPARSITRQSVELRAPAASVPR